MYATLNLRCGKLVPFIAVDHGGCQGDQGDRASSRIHVAYSPYICGHFRYYDYYPRRTAVNDLDIASTYVTYHLLQRKNQAPRTLLTARTVMILL